jgi:hypothetical protein
MRFLVAALVAIPVMAFGALAALGGSSNVPALRTNGPITKAEATAYANAVNLGVADVHEMVSVSQEGEHKEAPSSLEATCGVRESHVHVVDIESPKFRAGEGLQIEEVKSDVEVMPNVALAQRKFAQTQSVFKNARVLACFRRAFVKAFDKGLTKGVAGRARVAVGRTTLSILHPAVPHSFELRVAYPFTITGTARSIRSTMYVDIIGFFVGPAGIGLGTFSFNHPATAEQRLLSVLYGRAKG